MVQWLRTHTALVEDPSSQHPQWAGSSQPPVTPAPGDLTTSPVFCKHSCALCKYTLKNKTKETIRQTLQSLPRLFSSSSIFKRMFRSSSYKAMDKK